MADFDDEAGEPRFTQSGRLGRMFRMGSLAASVAGSAVARRLGATFGSEEEKAEAIRQSLLGDAERVVKTMGEMKGAAMKLGQMLSIAPEALPRAFLEELKSLQTDSPPMSFETVSQQIERGLGRPLVDVFRYFDPEPIGSASIGQVHKATLFDGRDVAVKIQYPGIAETIDSDVKNLASLLTMSRVVMDKARIEAIFDEVRTGLLEEVDYVAEAENLRRFGAILSAHEDVVVPAVIDEASSQAVLTMEFLEGTKLDVAIDGIEDRETRDDVAVRFSSVFVWMFHEAQVLHADPHPGNYLLMSDGRFAFLDFGCMRAYPAEFTDGWLDILVAKWSHRPERLPELFGKVGFAAQGRSSGLSARQLNELCEIVMAPFLYDRTFDWGTWQPQDAIFRWKTHNLAVARYAPAPESVFYFRVCMGVWGFLQRCCARGNWLRIGQDTARRRGRM